LREGRLGEPLSILAGVQLVGLGDKRPHLVVAGLVEIAVEGSHGSEGLGGSEDDDIVGFTAEFVAGGGGCYRDCDDDLVRDGTEGANGGAHGGSSGEPIVDEDYGLAFELKRGPARAILLLASLEFEAFAGDGVIDRRLRNTEFADDVLVEDASAVTG